MRATFTSADAWSGGFYELVLEVGPRSDERLVASVARLFAHPDLEGPYPARGPEPAQQRRASPAEITEGSLFGVGTLPSGDRVAVQVSVYRSSAEYEDSRDPEGTDWLGVYVPLGSLSAVWAEVGAYPFMAADEDPRAHVVWQERLEGWLTDLGRHLYDVVPFRLGAVGFDLDDYEKWWAWEAGVLPEERWDGILLADGSGGLSWDPPTRRGGHVLGDVLDEPAGSP